MAKSKTRKKKAGRSGTSGKVAWGGAGANTAGTRRLNVIIAAVALGAALAGGWYWYGSSNTERGFMALAAEGRERLDVVESKQSKGRRHLDAGESYNYGESFPTSGPHAQTGAPAGFHDRAPHPTLLVHALEHGNVVIYYDKPGEAVLDTLKQWSGLYSGQWDGLLAVPMSGLGESLMLTAWTKQLRMERFDAPLAAAFIDAYRGRGPEHPVR